MDNFIAFLDESSKSSELRGTRALRNTGQSLIDIEQRNVSSPSDGPSLQILQEAKPHLAYSRNLKLDIGLRICHNPKYGYAF
jgi:hypothetical protein